MSNESSATQERTLLSRSESCNSNYKDAPLGTLHREWPPWFSRTLNFLLNIAWNVRVLRVELGSLIHRRRVLRDKNSQHCVSLANVDVGPLFELEETGAHLRHCKETF